MLPTMTFGFSYATKLQSGQISRSRSSPSGMRRTRWDMIQNPETEVEVKFLCSCSLSGQGKRSTISITSPLEIGFTERRAEDRSPHHDAQPSAVQSPNRHIENACKSNPCCKWHETPSRNSIEPMERDYGGKNNQHLRNNVDHAKQRTVGAEEHP